MGISTAQRRLGPPAATSSGTGGPACGGERTRHNVPPLVGVSEHNPPLKTPPPPARTHEIPWGLLNNSQTNPSVPNPRVTEGGSHAPGVKAKTPRPCRTFLAPPALPTRSPSAAPSTRPHQLCSRLSHRLCPSPRTPRMAPLKQHLLVDGPQPPPLCDSLPPPCYLTSHLLP